MIELLIPSLIAYVLVNIFTIANPAKRILKLKRLKPFDCDTCLTFWLSLLYVINDTNIWFYPFISVLLTVILGKLVAILTKLSY